MRVYLNFLWIPQLTKIFRHSGIGVFVELNYNYMIYESVSLFHQIKKKRSAGYHGYLVVKHSSSKHRRLLKYGDEILLYTPPYYFAYKLCGTSKLKVFCDVTLCSSVLVVKCCVRLDCNWVRRNHLQWWWDFSLHFQHYTQFKYYFENMIYNGIELIILYN